MCNLGKSLNQQIINLLFEAGDPFVTVHLWLKKEYQGFRHTCSSM